MFMNSIKFLLKSTAPHINIMGVWIANIADIDTRKVAAIECNGVFKAY